VRAVGVTGQALAGAERRQSVGKSTGI
jgi:hypothetical protein